MEVHKNEENDNKISVQSFWYINYIELIAGIIIWLIVGLFGILNYQEVLCLHIRTNREFGLCIALSSRVNRYNCEFDKN